ncbi:MAG: chorismate mutase, partial [Candidatus Methanomethylicia archaeon]
KRIAEIKAKYGLGIYNGKRETEVLLRVRELSMTYNLNPDKIEAIFKAIISYCREVQEDI